VLEAVSSEPVTPSDKGVRSCPERHIRPPIRYGIDEYADAVSHDTREFHSVNICYTIEPYESLMCNKAWASSWLYKYWVQVGLKDKVYRSYDEVECFKV